MCQTFNGQTQSATTGNNYIELYGYTQAGQVTRKTLRLQKQVNGPQNPVTVSADLEGAYTYDSEGKMLTQSYPLGTTYQYSYDTLGRPIKLTDTQANQDLVGSVTYGPAGELISMSGTSVGETRSYNVNGQLTQINGLGMNIQYNYPAAGSNNGQIASQYDVITGETISYTYDSLKRLATATAVQGGGQTWNQNFTYDGFGNLTAKTGSGIAPVGSYPVDANTNRLSGVSYDNNGNQLYANGSLLAYDVSNRMISSTGGSLAGLYEYDSLNQRVYQQRQSWNGSTWVASATEFYFYGISGKKVGTYYATVSGSGSGTTLTWSLQGTQVYFRGKLLSNPAGDIRGSIGRYFPFGEDRDNTANDAVKFATYTRDSVSGLDYSVNRHHYPGTGRFTRPDPYIGSAQPSEPSSWNRYLYAGGEPISQMDPDGLDSYLSVSGYYFQYWDYLAGHGTMNSATPCDNGTRKDAGDLPPCPAGGGGSQATAGTPLDHSYSQAGINNAKAALSKLSKLDLSKCADLFSNTLHIDIATLEQEAAAATAYLYDGSTSNTPARSIGLDYNGTVGQFFNMANPLALSQQNGLAIWINSATFANSTPIYAPVLGLQINIGVNLVFPAFVGSDGQPTNYAVATMLHEMIHKFAGWADDIALQVALGVKDPSVFDTAKSTTALLQKCF